MNTAAKQLEYYTIEVIHNLPDGQRAELIDGELYMMPPLAESIKILYIF